MAAVKIAALKISLKRPSRLERAMINTAKFLIGGGVVLLAFHAQVLAQKADVGKAEYLSSCGACHGADGKGKGPLADQLKVPPANLTQLAKKNGGVFPTNAVYETIDGRQEVKAHGPRDMPVWGYQYMPLPIAPNQPFGPKALSKNREIAIRGRILSLIDYLSSLQEK